MQFAMQCSVGLAQACPNYLQGIRLVPRPNFSRTPRGLVEKQGLDTFTTKTGAVNWVIVGVNYIINNQQRLLWHQKICKLAIYDDA